MRSIYMHQSPHRKLEGDSTSYILPLLAIAALLVLALIYYFTRDYGLEPIDGGYTIGAADSLKLALRR
ncbi:MAG: hypothetical protein J0L97_00335 [Alphaproteobacteria bacterium]|nr:hypothetical protein [Alphaproteobacteria bacterium]